jgi:gamma-glutamyltranspeptidase/glutathione hydrolase
VTEIARSSPHAVTIPGAVEAWCRLLNDFGRTKISEVLQPAIAMASEGYAITPRVAADLERQRDLLTADEATRTTFLVNGKAPVAGDIQRQPLLAQTLQAIASEGKDAFYRGAVAEDMTDYLRSLGGRQSLEDFASTEGEYVVPISTIYRGRTIYECPPNGQGVVSLLILNILSRFERSKDPYDLTDLHVLLEATRLSYAARDAMVADPSMSDDAARRMLSDALADELAGLISFDKISDANPFHDKVEHTDTVYISVVDRDRNAVSFINSLFFSYGSGLMAPRSGVLFHNRGQSFSLTSGHPNEVAPRKRPMHTIMPGMVAERGRVTMPFGIMGGHYQAMGHAHLLARLYDCNLDLQTAIDLPRLFPLPATTTVEAEETMRLRVGAELERRGWTIQPPRSPIGGAQAILIDWQRGILIGASDHRKDGIALGY